MLDNLILGFQTALTPQNVLWCFVGVLLGTVIGLLPGLGSTTGVAILLPLTFAFEPVTALIMLAGIYYGARRDDGRRRSAALHGRHRRRIG